MHKTHKKYNLQDSRARLLVHRTPREANAVIGCESLIKVLSHLVKVGLFEEAHRKCVVSYKRSIDTNSISHSLEIWRLTSCRQKTWFYTYSSLVWSHISQSYTSNFRTMLGFPSRGRITVLIRGIISRLFQRMWLQSTIITDKQTDGETDRQATFSWQ